MSLGDRLVVTHKTKVKKKRKEKKKKTFFLCCCTTHIEIIGDPDVNWILSSFWDVIQKFFVPTLEHGR